MEAQEKLVGLCTFNIVSVINNKHFQAVLEWFRFMLVLQVNKQLLPRTPVSSIDISSQHSANKGFSNPNVNKKHPGEK